MESFDRLSDPDRVLLRIDGNVPVSNGTIQDTYRVDAVLPTIRELQRRGASQLIIATHRGRPEGRDDALSTKPVADYLDACLSAPVAHTDAVTPRPDELPRADIVVLENVRYDSGETENDDSFAAELSRLADTYVNDAFGTGHRKHASTYGVQAHLPSYTGLLIEEELRAARAVRDTQGSLGVLLGGAKLSGKLGVLQTFEDKAETMCIGGAMMLPFFAGKGWSHGAYDLTSDDVKAAEEMEDSVVLPDDVVVAPRMESESGRVVDAAAIPGDAYALDIGPSTRQAFLDELASCDVIVWNGPMGYCENPAFAEGTEDLLDGLADVEGDVVIGGGDTGSLVHDAERGDDYTHVSTGGGAFLVALQTGSLPVLD